MCDRFSWPVVSQVHAVRVEHGNDLKDHMITQDLSDGMLADQKVDETCRKDKYMQ